MKKFILSTVLLCVFTATSTYAGTLKLGAGTKIQSHLLTVSSHAIPMVIDYNHDGMKDLIIGDENGYVWFYQNFGSDNSPVFDIGTEIKVSGIPIKVNSRAAPFIVQWDNEKDLDLIVGNSTGQLTLFRSSNDLPFSHSLPVLQQGVSIPGINSHPHAVPYVYDWNDDNKKDLIIGDANGNIWAYLNSGTNESPMFNGGSKVLGTGSVALSVGNDAIPRVEQWDGVGNKDLVVGNSKGEVYVFLSGTKTPTGTPTFTTGKKVQADNKDIDVGLNAAPFLTYWDNDDRIDLLVGEKDGSLNLFRNISNKPLVFFSISTKIAGALTDLDAGSRVIPFVIDFNNDGKKDLVVGNSSGDVSLYLNSGTNQAPVFTNGYAFQVDAGIQTGIIDLSGGNYASSYVYDWDGNNSKDLIVGEEWGYIYLFINLGTDEAPIFRPGTKATTGTGTKEPLKVTHDATPIICDWNNDGNMDIVVGERYGYVNLFLNSGTQQKPIFVQSQRIKANGNDINVGYNAKPFVADFNSDRKKDLIIGNVSGDVKVYLNIGEDNNPIFTSQQPHCFQVEANSKSLEVSGYAAPVVIDWDEDKILDLIVGEKEGYINLYLGTLENSPPSVIPETPIGTQSNNVTINYFLKDDEQRPSSIVVEYSTDFGNTWASATAVIGAGDGKSNLNSSKEGLRHSFVWDSNKDLAGNFIGKVIIKIIPHDGTVGGTPERTNEFGVDNMNPPTWERIKLNGADLNLDAYSTPIVADWDEDGKRDLLIGSENGYVYFCKNVGLDKFPVFNVAYPLQVTGGELLRVNNHSSPSVYDWNSTGDKDLLVGDSNGYVTFFENTGSTLAPGKRIKVGTEDLKVPGNAIPVVLDWNNDGYKDLIVGDKNGNLYLYLNKNISPQLDISPLLSEGVKIQANSDLDVGNNATPLVYDWDKDYKDDLIIGNSDGNVFYYKNIGSNGTPSFSSGTRILFEGNEIKVNANSRPFVLKQDNDNNIDLIIGSNAGYVFLYHLTQVARNTSPQLIITNPKGTQSRLIGSITITYTLQDAQWDSCNIRVEFSTDGQNWYPATGTPKTNLASSPQGKGYTFIWFSRADLPEANDKPIVVKFTPNDGKIDGSATMVSFILDNQNKLPMVSNVVCKSSGNGQVEISYDLQDEDNDKCRVLVEYQGGSVENKWATATVMGTTTNILSSTGLKLIWLSSVDEKNQSAKDYKIKVTPYDIEYGTSGISTSFELNNSSISSAIVAKGTRTTLSFSPTTIEILEPFSNDFDVLITVERNPKGIPPMNTLASLNNTVRKITAVKLPDITPAPLTKAKITIPYDNLDSYDNEILLRMFELRENKWILVGGKPDVVNNRVTAEVEHFSVFRIGLHAVTLNEFSVSPNPFKDNDGIKENGELCAGGEYEVITFQGISKVEIYTIAGELVRESKESEISAGVWLWDLRNDYGRLVGCGIYIYVAKDSTGASVVGKLGVIR